MRNRQNQDFTPDPKDMPVMPCVDELKSATHFHGIRRGGSCHLQNERRIIMLRALLFTLFTISFIACGNDDTSEINQLREDITRLEIVINEEITRLESLIGTSPEKENITLVDTSQIVFVYDGGIHIMDANGQHVKRIYDRPASDARPKWSHDGKHIVFMSASMRDGFRYSDICVINADGSHPTAYTNRVSSKVLNPIWTRQGEIVYEGSVSGYGGGLLLGFASIRGGAFQADYRADGTLVFVKDLKTTKPERYQGIYTLNPLAEKEMRLTFDSDSYPTWSPDGTQIAFMSDRETFAPHIWTMRADGTKLKKLHPGRAPDWK